MWDEFGAKLCLLTEWKDLVLVWKVPLSMLPRTLRALAHLSYRRRCFS
jgi:hypothetical protein